MPRACSRWRSRWWWHCRQLQVPRRAQATLGTTEALVKLGRRPVRRASSTRPPARQRPTSIARHAWAPTTTRVRRRPSHTAMLSPAARPPCRARAQPARIIRQRRRPLPTEPANRAALGLTRTTIMLSRLLRCTQTRCPVAVLPVAVCALHRSRRKSQRAQTQRPQLACAWPATSSSQLFQAPAHALRVRAATRLRARRHRAPRVRPALGTPPRWLQDTPPAPAPASARRAPSRSQVATTTRAPPRRAL